MTDKYTFSAGTSLPEILDSFNPEIQLITRSISPLLTLLGFPGGLIQAENVRHEWFEEALNANSSTVNGDQTNVDTALEVATGTGSRFAAGDILQVDGSRELISVTSVATDTLTVVRGIRGTTGVAITSGATVKRMNNPPIESETAPAGTVVNRVRQANYTEIFRKVASVTRSVQQVTMIGVDDELDHQEMLVKKDLLRDLAHSVINGKKQTANPEGTTTQARTMDGIIQMILGGTDPASVAAAGASLSEALLNQTLEMMFTRGGNPKVLAAPPRQRRALSALLEGRQRYPVENKTLGAVVERFISDFGSLDVLEPDIFIPSDCILILDTGRISLAKLGQTGSDPFETVDLGRTGLKVMREVVGEFTLEMHNAGDGGHALISGLATS